MNLNFRHIGQRNIHLYPMWNGVPHTPYEPLMHLAGLGLLDPGSSCVPGANCPTGSSGTAAPYTGGACTVNAVMAKYPQPPNIQRSGFQPSTDGNVFTTPSYAKELQWAGMLGSAIDNNIWRTTHWRGM